jgi:hypothetical protein
MLLVQEATIEATIENTRVKIGGERQAHFIFDAMAPN